MKLKELKFDNHFEKLGDAFFAKATPTPLDGQSVAAVSKASCELIDLDEEEVLKKSFLDFSNKNFCNLAMLYSGHQFGHYVEQLGDGRAILLAQIRNKKQESWDLVLKGSGLTPYSRPYVQNADGKSVLRSAIREYLVSESMFHLGIPTSRALCLIASKEFATRETFEPAAQIIRMAPSHVRFGSFEVFFYRKEKEQVKILADYVIKQNFSEITDDENKYENFLESVVISTAKLIAKWQAFGFCHGVLNTDNMSIAGVTFDYGPFAFLDEFNSNFICNHSDSQGLYSYDNQPYSGLWNLHAFAITLSSLISMEKQQEILGEYQQVFLDEYHDLMSKKLGFEKCDGEIKKLIYKLLPLMEKNKIDYTNFFRNLSNFGKEDFNLDACRGNSCGRPLDVKTTSEFASDLRATTRVAPSDRDFTNWFESYNHLLQSHLLKNRAELMNQSNPKFILRSYLLQTAIEKAYAGDFSEVKNLQKIMEKPFDKQKENENYAKVPPVWSKEIVISCSS